MKWNPIHPSTTAAAVECCHNHHRHRVSSLLPLLLNTVTHFCLIWFSIHGWMKYLSCVCFFFFLVVEHLKTKNAKIFHMIIIILILIIKDIVKENNNRYLTWIVTRVNREIERNFSFSFFTAFDDKWTNFISTKFHYHEYHHHHHHQ